MQILARTVTSLSSVWKSILHWFKKRKKSAYDRELSVRVRLRLPGEHGEVTEQAKERWASVSRHGLVQHGITCPFCGHLAALAGRFELVHRTKFGDAVHCDQCKSILVASPDDDVDPVTPKKKYDEKIYHTFVRPAGVNSQGRQRITADIPKAGDWVVIISHIPAPSTASSTPIVLFGTEGRVEDVDAEAQTARVALSGNHGLGGAGGGVGSGLGGNWATFPLAHIAPMIQPSIRVGDAVKILRGEHAGKEAQIMEMYRGKLTLLTRDMLPGTISDVLIEHVEKFVTNERTF